MARLLRQAAAAAVLTLGLLLTTVRVTLRLVAVATEKTVERVAIALRLRRPVRSRHPAGFGDADGAYGVLALSATEMAARLRAGTLTSSALVRAHVDRAAAVDKTIAAVVAWRDAALAEAAAADAALADARARGTLGALPPFLGVPCTIKSCFEVGGLPQPAGVVHRMTTVATGDAPPVATLRRAGLIPITVTTTSELCLWYESFLIEPAAGGGWRRRPTGNPYDPRRIVGGSSGGEAALIASGGAPVGLGSDIGGSIRMPAGFCGIFGHKPTGGVVSHTGQHPTTSATIMTTGPLARVAEDLLPLLELLKGPDAAVGSGGSGRGGGRGGAAAKGDAALVVSGVTGGAAAAAAAEALRREWAVPQPDPTAPTTGAKAPSYVPLVGVDLPIPAPAGGGGGKSATAAAPAARRLQAAHTDDAWRPVVRSWADVTVYVVPDVQALGQPGTTRVDDALVGAVNATARALVERVGARGVSVLALPELAEAFDMWSACLDAMPQKLQFRRLMDECAGHPLDLGAELVRWALGASDSTLPAILLALVEDLPEALAPARQARLRAACAAARSRLHALLRDTNGLLVFPVHPTPACHHDVPWVRFLNAGYTQLFNCLELPVTVAPTGLDDASGVPLAVQLVGGLGYDRLTIAAAIALEAAGAVGWTPPAVPGAPLPRPAA